MMILMSLNFWSIHNPLFIFWSIPVSILLFFSSTSHIHNCLLTTVATFDTSEQSCITGSKHIFSFSEMSHVGTILLHFCSSSSSHPHLKPANRRKHRLLKDFFLFDLFSPFFRGSPPLHAKISKGNLQQRNSSVCCVEIQMMEITVWMYFQIVKKRWGGGDQKVFSTSPNKKLGLKFNNIRNHLGERKRRKSLFWNVMEGVSWDLNFQLLGNTTQSYKREREKEDEMP